MTVKGALHVFVTYIGLLIVLCDIVCTAAAMRAAPGRAREDSAAAGDYTYSAEVQARIDTFKRDVLNTLGYKRPPSMANVTRNIEEKRRMIQEYRRYIEEQERVFRDEEGEYEEGREDEEEEEDGVMDEKTRKVESKTVYSMEYKGGRPGVISQENWNATQTVRLYFPTYLSHPEGDHTRELHVHSAKLKLFIREVRPANLRDKLSVDNQIRLNVYQILSITNSTSYKRTLLDSKLVSLDATGFVNFEIARAVQNWVNERDSNLGVEIATESQDLTEVVTLDTSYRVTNETGGHSSKHPRKTSPNIQLYVQERDIIKRVKRHAHRRNTCKMGSGESKCCRYPIKISFREIGWDDWIVAPQEYRGYYCAGECPGKFKMANTFVGIKAMLHEMQPSRVPSPCCVATKLSPFMVLHYDNNGKYTFSKWDDLVVDQCMCG